MKLRKNKDALTSQGIQADQIVGFRAPYYEYGKNSFSAVKSNGFLYDASLDDYDYLKDGTNNLWPFTLDNGYPYDEDKPLVGKVPGLWELPVRYLVIPPDKDCSKYGIAAGAYDRIRKWYLDAHSGVDTQYVFDGKIKADDQYLWMENVLPKAEALAVLEYTFDQAYENNRAPFILNFHPDMNTDTYQAQHKNDLRTTVEERKSAIAEFIDYTLKKRATRIVSHKKLVDWMKNPVRISAEGVPTPLPSDAAEKVV